MVLIRRSLVMMGYLARFGTKNTYKAKFEALSAALDDAPSVDAEPVRHGKWGDLCRGKVRICNCCKHNFDNTCNDIDGEWMFCPHCGAKMDGGDEK